MDRAAGCAKGVFDPGAGITATFGILHGAALGDIVVGPAVEINASVFSVYRHSGTNRPVVDINIFDQKIAADTGDSGKSLVGIGVNEEIANFQIVYSHKTSIDTDNGLTHSESYAASIENRPRPRGTTEPVLINAVIVVIAANAAASTVHVEYGTWPSHSALEDETVPRCMGIRSSKTLHARRPFPRGRRRSPDVEVAAAHPIDV